MSHCATHVSVDFVYWGNAMRNSNLQAEQQSKGIKAFSRYTKHTQLSVANGFERKQNLRSLMGESEALKEVHTNKPGRFHLHDDSETPVSVK